MMDGIQSAWETKKPERMDSSRATKDECWYEEIWADEDLEIALENAGAAVTDENVEIMKRECLHIFDDKFERNEMLADKARSIFCV
ncbi:MAG: hypothetical protein LUG93_13280 [Lachnospiraceae bacterium]|nr:hypothetical protein [Lachnospiraceae bacterium]